MTNAMQALFADQDAGAYERGFDTERHAYLKEINDCMQERAGVRYIDVQNAIHPGNEAYKTAFDYGVSAETFVAGTMEDFGFVSVGRVYPRDDAKDYNEAKAALVEFAGKSVDWNRGDAGTVFSQMADGVASIRPVREKRTGRFGFGVEFHEGASLDELGRRLAVTGEIKGQYGAHDIGDAVEAFRSAYGANRAYSF